MDAEQIVYNFTSIKDDITRNYHGGDAESTAANLLTNKDRDRRRILEHLEKCGPNGDTCDHIEQALGISHQTCSARCSELKRDGMVIRKPVLDGIGYAKATTRSGALAALLIIPRFVNSIREESGQISFL